MAQALVRSSDRFQVRLLDLFIVILGAAYVLDVARRSRIAWGGGWPDFAHGVGLAVLSLGVAVTLSLVVQWASRQKLREGRAWATIWRVVAMGWLVGTLVEVAAACQDPSPDTSFVFGVPDTLRLRLDSLTAMMGMVGLILAVAPLGNRSGGVRPRSRWGSFPTVLLATLIGLVLIALGHGILPYLVMLALEAVHNALRLAPLIKRPIVFDRMATASLETLPGLVGCLLTASWVDDDMRAAFRDSLAVCHPRTWWAWLARASTVVLAGVGSAYVVVVSIPKLSPPLAEGLATIIDRSLIASIALGFGALAAGFAARSAACLAMARTPEDPSTEQRPSRTTNPWPRRMMGGFVGLVSLAITLAAVSAIRKDGERPWYVPLEFETWKNFFSGPEDWFGTKPGFLWYRLLDHPDDFLNAIAAFWLIERLFSLARSKNPHGQSPMDLVVKHRGALGRFLGWSIALTTAMLASLPGMAIIGVTLLHFVIQWIA